MKQRMEIRVKLKLQLAKYPYNLFYTNDNNISRAKKYNLQTGGDIFAPTIE